MPNTLTREEFIEKANKVHNGMFSYPDFEYKGYRYKIPIYCHKHKGIFWQTPKMHLIGHGCNICRKYPKERYKNKMQQSLDGEIWKDVKGFEGYYKVSNFGRIASCLDGLNVLSLTNKKGDYFSFILRKGKYTKSTRIHRVVYETFVGEIPKGYYIHHIDGNKQNNKVENLKLLSPIEHSKEHYIKNLIMYGCDITKTKKTYRYEIKDGKVIGLNKDFNHTAKQTDPSSGRFITARHRPINQLTLNGEFIRRFETATDAFIHTGVCARNILQVANKTPFNAAGAVRKQAGGYIWEFAN